MSSKVVSHTPGPWQSYVGNTRFCVETVAFPAKLTAIVYAGQDSPSCTNDPEQEANARLIAAAPELLAALKAAEERLTYFSASGCAAMVQHSLGLARAAIAKAEGHS